MERQPTVRQLALLKAHAEALIVRHTPIIEQIERDMQNFDIPAQRSINAGFSRMSTDRFTPAGDDLWEMIQAIKGDWTYSRPARHLAQRWAGY
jgi:hypothetical protein